MATVTVSVRSLVVTVAATVAVFAAYLVGSTGVATSAAVAAQQPASGDVPSIVMTGTGDASGVPDQLTFSLAVHTTAADVSTALHSSSTTTSHVLHAVRAQQVAPKDVQTTGLSINAIYDYNGNGPPVITGYAVSQSMSVLVRRLSDAGATISAAVSAGGNAVRLHDVRLQVGNEDALLHQARAAAFDQARVKAEQYAAAAGRQLGAVSSVREVHVASSVDQSFRSAPLDAAAAGSVPIRPGTADLHVTVSVVWSFG